MKMINCFLKCATLSSLLAMVAGCASYYPPLQSHRGHVISMERYPCQQACQSLYRNVMQECRNLVELIRNQAEKDRLEAECLVLKGFPGGAHTCQTNCFGVLPRR